MAVVEPPGGSIEAIDEPSPASQPAMSRMTIGEPWSAIVATRLPSADVARSRSPLGPSVWSPVSTSTMVASGAPASPVIDDQALVVEPDRRRGDDRLVDLDLERARLGRVDQDDPDVLAREEIAREHRVAAAVRFPGREVGRAGRGVAGGVLRVDVPPSERLAETERVARCRRAVVADRGQDVLQPGRDPDDVTLRQLDRDRLAAAAVPADQGRLVAVGDEGDEPVGRGRRLARRGRVRAGRGDDHERGTDGREWQPAAGRGWHRRGKCATPMRARHVTSISQ